MTQSTEESKFSELFGVITKYSQGDHDYQKKALQVIAGIYEVPLEIEPMPNAKQVVDDILGQYDYVFPIDESGGGLDPHSVDAVVRVALYEEENREWGINRLSRTLEGLVKRLNTEEGYPDYVEDSDPVMNGLRTVVAGSLAEEIVEEIVDELEEIVEDLEAGA
jgi:hypothetical protein